MSQHYSAPSAPKLAPRDPDAVSADSALVPELQHAAQIANENCDRAMALAHKLSGQLREAQHRINELEIEADGLVDGLRKETEAVVAKLQANAEARVERAKSEADERIGRLTIEAENRVSRAQEELAQTEVEGQSGAGLVKVVMTCRHDVKRVSIDPSLLADDRDMLEDLVMAAMNDAVAKAQAATQAKMSGFTAGLNLPPGMGLPF